MSAKIVLWQQQATDLRRHREELREVIRALELQVQQLNARIAVLERQLEPVEQELHRLRKAILLAPCDASQ